ncbi:MAG: hypothetical protein JJU11_11910 [Candidatus Sumerlaeia bacterium]|nr:hypothetical protein [Candidatus Sumerlaeia bacterium]
MSGLASLACRLFCVGALLLSANGSPADDGNLRVGFELRRGLEHLRAGDLVKATDLLEDNLTSQRLSSNERQHLEALISFYSEPGLESARALVPLLGGNWSNEDLNAIILEAGNHLGSLNQNSDAEAIFLDIIAAPTSESNRDRARCALLNHYWIKSDYKDADWSAAFAEHFHWDLDEAGKHAHRRGLHLIRSGGNYHDARGMFHGAVEDGWDNAAASRTMARYAGLIADIIDEKASQSDLCNMMTLLVHHSQGVDNRTVNPVLVAWYTVRGLSHLEEVDAGTRALVLSCFAGDPVYGRWGAEAAALVEELLQPEGEGAALRRSEVETELAHHNNVRAAIREGNNGNIGKALAILEDVKSHTPPTRVGRDARLRIGYIHLMAEDRAAAAHAFEEALVANADLSPSHPFNREALFRLKQIHHGDLYARATHSRDNPTRSDENQELLEKVLDLNTRLLGLTPAEVSDKHRILLEQAGLLFEQATNLDSADAWANVRSLLEEIMSEEDFPAETRATAHLMKLESFYWDGDYGKVLDQFEELKTQYPENWKQLGTATVYTCWALSRMDRNDERAAHYRWLLDTFPPDSDYYPTINYRMHALYNLSESNRVAGNTEEAARLRDLAVRLYPKHFFNTENYRW